VPCRAAGKRTPAQTGRLIKPVADGKQRIDHIATLEHSQIKIIIPTPASPQCLYEPPRGCTRWLKRPQTSHHFRVAAFGERAVVEYAAMQAERKAMGGKRRRIGRR
jgi:hypothetical protein